MKLRQLEFVMWITRLGSFSKAASKLHVAQPAISKQINALEAEYGVELFHRDGHGAVPTNAAKILCATAERIFAQLKEAKTAILNSKESPTGVVRLGVPPSLSSYFSTKVDDLIKSQYPAIGLKVSEGWTGFLYDWIVSDIIDLGIIYSSQVTEYLVWEPLVTEDVCVIGMPAGKPCQMNYSLTQVARLPLVLPPRPHGLRLVIDKVFSKYGLSPNIVNEAEVWSILKDQVERGEVFALLPPSEVREEIESHRLCATPIAKPGIKRTLCIARSNQKRMTKAVEKVFETIFNETILRLPKDQWYLANPPVGEYRENA